MSKSLFHITAKEMADLVVKKQAAYGDSFGKSGNIMKILYPNGIKVDQLNDALTMVRVIDKLFRVATDKQAFGENPWKDILGYSLLAVAKEYQTNLTRLFLKDFNLKESHTKVIRLPSIGLKKPSKTRSPLKRTKSSLNKKRGLK